MPISNNTTNQSPLIKAQVFSDFLLEAIHDGLLADGLHRDVSDFGNGQTLYVSILGEAVLRDYTEGQPAVYDKIDSGQIMLAITEYVQAGAAVTRKLQQDGYQAAAMEAAIPREHLRLIKERYESDLLSQVNKQTLASDNAINGFSHRWVAASATTNGVLDLEDFLYAKLALDKALITPQSRIAIVDPIVEATLNKSAGAQAFINNPKFEGVVNTGFARENKFLWNIYGFDVYTSNRLPVVTETITGGPTKAAGAKSITAGVVNQFLCVADDQLKPYMGAWRQMPQVDSEFNKDLQQDEYVTTARWGFGMQRPQTVIGVLSSATLYK